MIAIFYLPFYFIIFLFLFHQNEKCYSQSDTIIENELELKVIIQHEINLSCCI